MYTSNRSRFAAVALSNDDGSISVIVKAGQNTGLPCLLDAISEETGKAITCDDASFRRKCVLCVESCISCGRSKERKLDNIYIYTIPVIYFVIFLYMFLPYA